jgi:hypothetical protein
MFVISEEEKKEILKKYQDNTSGELLTYLKRHFPMGEVETPFGFKRYVMVDDKMRYLKQNKKYLVNKISGMVESEWISLGDEVLRRTVKKYIDGITA